MFKTLIATLMLIAATAEAKTVRYELEITRRDVNLSGSKTVDFALMVNGAIPAPTLEFTEGDDAELVVKNGLTDDEVSIHWHGILLPPEMDGVAYVNTPPIFPGNSHTFKFRIRQHGTYWYHSHTNVQEQKGVYGALIIHPKKKTIAYDKEAVAVLSDWSDENASQIIKNLRKDGDYYAYKKGTLRSWLGAIQAGQLGTFLGNEWTRMGGMDLSDVGYDAFLINGKRDSQLLNAKPGEKVRIRIINAAGSSYFYVSLGQSPMKVISADGVDIEPMAAKEALIGMAETLDILFEVPAQKNFELRATAQDVTGYASAWIGMASGEKIGAPAKPYPDLYAPMDHGGGHAGHEAHGAAQEDHSQHEGMDHSKHQSESAAQTIETLQVDEIKAKEKTAFPEALPRYNLTLKLDGDMGRYIWHINGKAIHEERTLEIKEGDVVRFTFKNETMMHHPMHLHGHFFRVLNKNGDYSPLKHTVDVPPHGERTIEFYANEPGQWMLHCHNLYHMKTGMARVVKYMSYNPGPDLEGHQKHDPHLHDHLYYDGQLKAATNAAEGKFRLSKTWDTIEARAETKKDDDWETEGDVFFRRWLGQFPNFILGGTYLHKETNAVAGFGYTLPLLIEADLLVSTRGKFRLDLAKEFQWTRHIFSDVEVKFRQDEEAELDISLMYANQWNLSGGLTFTSKSVGAGLLYKF